MNAVASDVFTWYVAGPMSWRPQFNVPAFLAGAESLEARGYRAQLPADLDDETVVASLLSSRDGNPEEVVSGLTWGDCLALDVKLIADVVDGVAVLPGWNKSKGARLETFVAFLCGKPVVYVESMRRVRKKDLIKAWLATWWTKDGKG